MEREGILGFTAYEVKDGKVVDLNKFNIVLMKNGHCVEDVLISPVNSEALRNTIIGARNLIAWCEEQLKKPEAERAPVAPAGE